MLKQKELICFAIILISSTWTFGQQYPMLEDIKAVSVTIDHVGPEPNNPAINWPKLQLNLAKKVSEAGISIEPVKGIRLPGIPDLNITVMMVEIPDTEQFVFHIQTSLYRLVNIPEKNNLMISAPVWADLATIQSVAVEDTETAITKATTKQVGKFIEAWQSAQKKSASAEPNEKNTTATLGSGRATQQSDAKAKKYVASKNGKVFHCAECSTAKGLSPDNLITFASREQAVNSGRRACKRCNP